MGLVNSLIRPVQPLFEKYSVCPDLEPADPDGISVRISMEPVPLLDFDRQELSVTEGQYLLSFCNNLGPGIFSGFVLPSLIGNHIPIYSECMVFISTYPSALYSMKIPMSQMDFSQCQPVEHLLCRCWKHWMKQCMPAEIFYSWEVI